MLLLVCVRALTVPSCVCSGLFASQAFHAPVRRLPATLPLPPLQRAAFESCITHQNSELIATFPPLEMPVLVEIGTSVMPRWKEVLLVDRLTSAGLLMFKTQQPSFASDLQLFIAGAIENSKQKHQAQAQEQEQDQASSESESKSEAPTMPASRQRNAAFTEHLGAAAVLLGPLTIVYPSNDTADRDYQRYAWYLATQLYQSIGSSPAVLSDASFLQEAELRRESPSNVIVLGSPAINQVAHELLSCLPLEGM